MLLNVSLWFPHSRKGCYIHWTALTTYRRAGLSMHTQRAAVQHSCLDCWGGERRHQQLMCWCQAKLHSENSFECCLRHFAATVMHMGEAVSVLMVTQPCHCSCSYLLEAFRAAYENQPSHHGEYHLHQGLILHVTMSNNKHHSAT
jgi:hypothetical protein